MLLLLLGCCCWWRLLLFAHSLTRVGLPVSFCCLLYIYKDIGAWYIDLYVYIILVLNSHSTHYDYTFLISSSLHSTFLCHISKLAPPASATRLPPKHYKTFCSYLLLPLLSSSRSPPSSFVVYYTAHFHHSYLNLTFNPNITFNFTHANVCVCAFASLFCCSNVFFLPFLLNFTVLRFLLLAFINITGIVCLFCFFILGCTFVFCIGFYFTCVISCYAYKLFVFIIVSKLSIYISIAIFCTLRYV